MGSPLDDLMQQDQSAPAPKSAVSPLDDLMSSTAEPPAAAITNGRVLDSYGAAMDQGVENVANAGKNFVKGTIATFNPKQQPGENAFTQIPAVRMASGILSALGNAPAAVRGVMEAKDKLGYLAQPLSETAADLGVQAGGVAAAEATPDIVGGVGKAVKAVATKENIATAAGGAIGATIGHHLGSAVGGEVAGMTLGRAIGKAWGKAVTEAPEVAESAKSAPPSATTSPDILARLRKVLGDNKVPKGTAPETSGDAIMDRLDQLENPTGTSGRELKARLADAGISEPTKATVAKPAKLAPPTEPVQSDLPLTMGEMHPQPTPGATRVGSAQGALDDTALFKRAKESMPADTPISKIAGRAQELKQQGVDFEKIFKQPLSNYIDADGKFNMADFIHEVVKPEGSQPGTFHEPIPQAISKRFGAEGVPLVQEITGEPLHKWADEKVLPPSQTYLDGMSKQDASMNKSVSGGSPDAEKPTMKVANGDPQMFLRMIGAENPSSILKTPKDIESVNWMRKQIREGKPIPGGNPEIHVDQDNNYIDGDGRHRALAHAMEGVKKIKINIFRHQK